jgi:FkbM family methyltransferase
MKSLRIFLPLYLKTLEKFSTGRGYGKNKNVRKILKLIEKSFRSSEITVHGHKMHLPKKGFSDYSTYGIYGELDTFAVEVLVKKGEHVIDIGAAIGYFSLILARSVGDSGKVIAFEPKEGRCKILAENLSLNGYQNTVIENSAVMSKDVQTNFFSRNDTIAGLRYIKNENKHYDYLETYKFQKPVDVKITDLDDYLIENNLLDKISFMKIDVDGPELIVLQSAKKLLQNPNLKILMEWDQESAKWSECDPALIVDILHENGFKIYYPNYKQKNFFHVDKNQLMNLDPENQTINILCVKDESILEQSNLL